MKTVDLTPEGAGVWGGDHGTAMRWGWPCGTLRKNARTERHHTRPKVSRGKQTRTSNFLTKEKDIHTTRTPVKAIVSWKKLTSVSDLPVKAHGTKSPHWCWKRGREHVAGAQN